jgi:hypothetical protein
LWKKVVKLIDVDLSPKFLPSEPLWKRVPSRDASGKPFSDFMMVIPKLRSRPPHTIREVVNKIESVLATYENYVVFADLNLKLNVLWISIKPVPGMCLEVATAINCHVPDAKLIAQKINR